MTGIQVYMKTVILDYDYFMQHQSSANKTSNSRQVFGSPEYITEYSMYIFGTFAGSWRFTKEYTENGYDKGLTNDLKLIASRLEGVIKQLPLDDPQYIIQLRFYAARLAIISVITSLKRRLPKPKST